MVAAKPGSIATLSRLRTACEQPQTRNRTPGEALAKDRVRGQGPGPVGPASHAPVRPGADRECARGPEHKRRARRSAAGRGAGPSASQPRSACRPCSNPCEHKKRAGTGAGSCPRKALELVEHRPMHGVHHVARQVPWQRVVVALVEREVTQPVVLDDVLVEEAMQCPPFGDRERLEVPIRVRGELSHNVLLKFVVRRQEEGGGACGRRVRDRPRGHRVSGGGGNDFVRSKRSVEWSKWWGPAVLDAPVVRPSHWEIREQAPSLLE